MARHITAHRQGFSYGFTPITGLNDPEDDTGIAFGILRLGAGETHADTVGGETALLLLHGRVAVTYCGGVGRAGAESHAGFRSHSHSHSHSNSNSHANSRNANSGSDATDPAGTTRTAELCRRSLFDESPSCLHVAAGTSIRVQAVGDAEVAICATANTRYFAPRLYLPHDVPNEHRGKGQVGDTCYRYVRTIFDRNNAAPEAELVLGEVVTMPGRWSSYPPHHHVQPEIYHYRFTKPQGIGFSQLGDEAKLVRHGDTIKILGGDDHAQAAAPGYGMYYAWVIRHLPHAPYTVPEFTEEHRWIMEPGAPYWQPEGRDEG